MHCRHVYWRNTDGANHAGENDDAVHGSNWPEVLDEGLGIVKGIVPLPHAHRRLKLGDATRVKLMARRFAPALCAAFEDRASMVVRPGGWTPDEGIRQLDEQGAVAPMSAA